MELDENKMNSMNTDALEELHPNLEEIVEHQPDEMVLDVADTGDDVLHQGEENILTETVEAELESDNLQEENIKFAFEDYDDLSNDFDSLNIESTNEEVYSEEEPKDSVEIFDEEIMLPSEESLPITELSKKEEQMNETLNEQNKQTYVETVVVNNLVGGTSPSNNPAPVVNVTVEREKTPQKSYSIDDYMVLESHKGEVVLSKGEELIKSYRIIKNSGLGTATVTNRRLIIDANTRVEVPIEKVSGVSSSMHNEIKIAKLIFGVIFIGICLGLCLFDFNKVIPENFKWAIYLLMAVGGVFGLIGLLMVCTSFKRKFALSIFTEGLSPIISISSKRRKAEGNLIGSIEIAKRGKDFAKFTGEIGALIIHIKDAQNGKL